MDLGLHNKVALIFASSKGLGLACAKGLFREGAHVVICSRSYDHLNEAEKEILKEKSTNNNRLVSYTVNLKDMEQVEELISKVTIEFGRIDIFIHNAGGPPSGPILEITDEQWEESLEMNLKSFIYACNKILPIMQKQHEGRIIAITSVSVKQPLEGLVLSNTTRLGVVGYAKTAANKYGKDNILVNVVCPGPTLTDRMKELIEAKVKRTGIPLEEVKKQWTDDIPLGRLGTPEEFANLVIFLTSERASYITGTVIQVDGGFVKYSL